jgi:hypothetical protein
MKLTIELVPRTSWYNNVRSNVSKERWDELRNHCYNKAGHKCEICGSIGKEQGFNHNVECHEIWEYDEYHHVQRLAGLIALCPLCHKVKHAGLAQINGEENLVISQLMKVNNMDEFEAKNYLQDAFLIWDERSVFEWNVDISWLDNNGDQLSDLLSKMNKFRKD